MTKYVATALYQDSYFGQVEVQLQAFPTKHRGARVTRYRWICPTARAYPGYVPSTNPQRLINAARTDRRFSQVQEV